MIRPCEFWIPLSLNTRHGTSTHSSILSGRYPQEVLLIQLLGFELPIFHTQDGCTLTDSATASGLWLLLYFPTISVLPVDVGMAWR